MSNTCDYHKPAYYQQLHKKSAAKFSSTFQWTLLERTTDVGFIFHYVPETFSSSLENIAIKTPWNAEPHPNISITYHNVI